MVSRIYCDDLPTPLGTGHTIPTVSIRECRSVLLPPRKTGSDRAPFKSTLGHRCAVSEKGEGYTMEAQGHYHTTPPKGPLVNICFSHSNLGSGRSQQGQGLAQCDIA